MGRGLTQRGGSRRSADKFRVEWPFDLTQGREPVERLVEWQMMP
jgi:hypothetical protein